LPVCLHYSAFDRPSSLSCRRVELPPSEWERYAVVDPTKSYTRNLVATDHQTYTLLVLVWTPGRASAIHDHPCDGCWMRVLSGSIRECRYALKETPCCGGGDGVSATCLECIQDDVYQEGQVLHIEDCLGYHKVENPSFSKPAVTMHLYSPPFERCRVWLDETSATSSRSSWVQYDSEYGQRVEGAEHGEEALISSLGIPPPAP
jgi:cysteine dioxygenase